MTEDEIAGWHHGLDGRESEWTPGIGDGQGGLVCCDSWGRKESDTTEWLNWTELNESESDSHLVLPDSLLPYGLYSPWNSPGQNTGVGSFSLLQVIFSTQGSNPGLPHCRQILYQLSHQGSPRILDWVPYSFSSGFLIQKLNLGLWHCRWILYQLRYWKSLHCINIRHQK